jgi:ABC-type Mn2+/Zn2+ transport system permease subunit
LASVPEPPVKSTVTVRLVLLKDAITPSMKLVGVLVFAALTLSPAAKADNVDATVVVNTFEPVPINNDVFEIRAV